MSANFAEFLHKIFNGKVFLFFAGNVIDDFAFVHHNKAVAVFDGIAHIMGYHKRCELVCVYDFVGDFLAVATGEKSLFIEREEHEFVGVHAGLTEDEMTVPFIAIETKKRSKK